MDNANIIIIGGGLAYLKQFIYWQMKAMGLL